MPQIAKDESVTYSLDCLLADLQRRRFYGSIELKLEAGQVELIRKTETLKPLHDYRNTRGTDNEHTP